MKGSASHVEGGTYISTDSDQLGLFGPGEVDPPWGGQSPRVLTAAYRKFILEAGAGGRMSKLILTPPVAAHQCKGPVYDGAPLLLPFPKEG